MKIGYWNGFSKGVEHGVEFAASELRKNFERSIALLQEELADLRQERNAQQARADAACDLLLGHLGARAISLAGKQEEVERHERMDRGVRTLTTMIDPTEELPIGDPRGLFKSASEAGLFSDGEDVAGVEH